MSDVSMFVLYCLCVWISGSISIFRLDNEYVHRSIRALESERLLDEFLQFEIGGSRSTMDCRSTG